ncbi:MAG: NAD(P)-binding protein [Clostridia bacterium]
MSFSGSIAQREWERYLEKHPVAVNPRKASGKRKDGIDMYDMIIVGAGPAGATLARGLGRRYRVLLVDKRNS